MGYDQCAGLLKKREKKSIFEMFLLLFETKLLPRTKYAGRKMIPISLMQKFYFNVFFSRSFMCFFFKRERERRRKRIGKLDIPTAI